MFNRLASFVVIAFTLTFLAYASYASAQSATTAEAVARNFAAALEAGDPRALADMLDDDLRFTAAGSEDQAQGEAYAIGYLAGVHDCLRAGGAVERRVQVGADGRTVSLSLTPAAAGGSGACGIRQDFTLSVEGRRIIWLRTGPAGRVRGAPVQEPAVQSAILGGRSHAPFVAPSLRR